MPPRPKPAPPNVARLPPDEQISYLVQQHEEFSDWRIKVDERLDKTETAVDRLTESSQRVESMQGQILFLLQGQKVPGLERPGLTEDVAEMKQQQRAFEQRMTTRQDAFEQRTDSRLTPIEALKARFGYGVAGGTAILAAINWKVFISLYKVIAALAK